MSEEILQEKMDIKGQKIKSTPKEPQEIGIDTTNTLAKELLMGAFAETLNVSALDNFSNVAQTRENVYKLIDSMAQDSTISSILETYTEDIVETNDQGRIVWVESSDGAVAKHVSYLLDSLNIDKHIYGWAYSLVKYGDLYLRLYRKSDYEIDDLFTNKDKASKDTTLNEEVNLIMNKPNDPYVHYVEMVDNPGEMFELTKFGKTMGYVKAPTAVQNNYSSPLGLVSNYYQYKMNQGDVDIFPPTAFVHAYLEDNSPRVPEQVDIFLDNQNDKKVEQKSYKVRRGQSLLYNTFKAWRELSLLENSVLLNRVTKSSIIRLLQVEVGDMPKEAIGPHMRNIKNLIEQKAAIDTGVGMSEYTNPGPVENIVYVPTHGGIGSISSQQIGGDVDVKGLADLEYYRDKFFAAWRVPKQYFGFTSDSAGFNGGTSLSIISSRYGKSVKRIQNTLIQALTDILNLMLIDAGLSSYINKFQLRMLAPLTQEELDRRDNISNRVRVISDLIGILTADISDDTIKLKMLKSLLTGVVTDIEVINLIQEQIDKIEYEVSKKEEDVDIETEETTEEETHEEETIRNFDNFEDTLFNKNVEENDVVEKGVETEEVPEVDEDDYLPTPNELNA